MSSITIAVCGVLYLLAAVDLARKGQTGLALAFLAYAIANVGLIVATHQGAK